NRGSISPRTPILGIPFHVNCAALPEAKPFVLLQIGDDLKEIARLRIIARASIRIKLSWQLVSDAGELLEAHRDIIASEVMAHLPCFGSVGVEKLLNPTCEAVKS